MEDKLQRIRDLINLKEMTDAELEGLLQGGTANAEKPKQTRTCKTRGQTGHRSDACPQKAGVDAAVKGLAANLGVAS
jgi:hypothetical protein